MMQVEELRPLTAGQLLAIRREVAAGESDEAAWGLLCNAEVLAESCFAEGKPVFPDREAVLAALTIPEMEVLLARLVGGGKPEANPQFDEARFRRLRGE